MVIPYLSGSAVRRTVIVSLLLALIAIAMVLAASYMHQRIPFRRSVMYITKTVYKTVGYTTVIYTTSTTTVTSYTTLTIPSTLTTVKPVLRVIDTWIRGTVIRFREVLFFNVSEFKIVVREWPRFREVLRSYVAKTFGENVELANVTIDLNTSARCVTIEFDVVGRVWVSDGEVTADFLWLLTPLGLDFIESHFEETNHGLFWRGVIDGVETLVNVYLPKQPVAYRAWGEPVGHCHGHAWWPLPRHETSSSPS